MARSTYGSDREPAAEGSESLSIRVHEQTNQAKLVSDKAYLRKKAQLEAEYLDDTWAAQKRAREEYYKDEIKRAGSNAAEVSRIIADRERERALWSAQEHERRMRAETEALEFAEKCAKRIYNRKSIYQRTQLHESLRDAKKLEIEQLRSLDSLSAEQRVQLEEAEASYREQLEIIKRNKKIQEEAWEQSATEQEKLARAQQELEDAQKRQRQYKEEELVIEKELAEIAKERAAARDAAAQAELDKAAEALEKRKAEVKEKLKEAEEDVDPLTEGSAGNKVAAYTESAHQEKLADIQSKSANDIAAEMARQHEIDVAERRKQVEADKAYRKTEAGKQEERQKRADAAMQALNNALAAIDGNIASFFEYQGKIEARLQGSEESYKDAIDLVKRNVGISGVVSQKKVLENIRTLVDSGIAYNLELRGFIATMSENIASTFNAFDSNLLRIIRIQQADSTAARLGMEARLTTLFNQWFSDTSYLTDAFDTVAGSILDASAQLTKNQSLEFEYMVQKWLGSLYSLGVSDSAVSTIAEGLNYLGTGNVEALNSNDSLQTLMAMSASRAGISYADILTGGLDASTTNKLMKSMVEYLSDIASNTDNNQVTKAAYSNLFGMNITDLLSISNIQSGDLEAIYNSSMTYQSALEELDSQLNSVTSRLHISQIIDNVIENASSTTALTIGNNAATYGLWKVLNIVEDLTGGIALPFMNVMGFGVDLNTTVTGLAKTGIAGLGLMGSLLGSLGNGSLFGTYDLSKWQYDEYTSRGSGLKRISQGTASGFSKSEELSIQGTSSGDDVKNTSMADAAADAEQDSKITNQSTADQADEAVKFNEKVLEALTSTEGITVLSELIGIKERLSEGRIFNVDTTEVMKDLLARERIFFTLDTGLNSPTILNFARDNLNTTFNEGTTSITEETTTTQASADVKSYQAANNLSTHAYLENIISKSAENAATSKAVQVEVVNDAANVVKTELTGLSEGMKNYVNNALRHIIAAALTEDLLSENGETTQDSVVAKLTQALNHMQVTVDNDNFNDFLQKATFGGL